MAVKRESHTLLEETFYVFTKKHCVFRVRLARNGICLIKESAKHLKEQLIPIDDVVGCRCLRSKKKHARNCACQSLSGGSHLKVVEESSSDLDVSDVSAYLYIYAYMLIHRKGGCKKRERTIITLRFRSFDKYEDNNKEAQRWRSVIKRLCKGDSVSMTHIADFSLSHKYKEMRKLLVLCNPKSGPGKGRLMFQEKVAPILDEAEIPYDLHITKYANYAREFVRTCNVYQWSGILLVGGDGIVFEAINGLLERPDWSESLRCLPIGVVPSGSGNGLARSIAHYSDEPYQPAPTLPAALAAVRHGTAALDLVRVETTSQILFSFLSVGWGFLSDIDIESESLRILGGQRFTLWSIYRLLTMRTYGGKVWFLPAEKQEENQRENGRKNGGGDQDINLDEKPSKVVGSASDLPNEISLETQLDGRQRLDSWYSATSRRSAYFSATGSSYQSTAGSGGGGGDENGGENEQDKPRMYGPASRLPCVTAALPTTRWRCIEGRFIMVYAAYQSHLSGDCFFVPEAKPNDGLIHLMIVRGDVTRGQLFTFLTGMSSGTHVAMATEDGPVQLHAVTAFRIEPEMAERTGHMTVDGERVEYGPIQAEIFPRMANVMVP